MEAARLGGSAPILLNAANEVAVEAFLNGDIPFTRIAGVVATVLADTPITEPDTLKAVQAIDQLARQFAMAAIQRDQQEV
jgi:1-deoxy-D-xylulose-5-phosphate reductoisomerase